MKFDLINVNGLSDMESSSVATLRLAVIMTCFNRKQHTLECLHALATNTSLEKVQMSVVLVDDGSTDGTADAVRAAFPWVHVVIGDSNLFWCRGMYKAFDIALQGNYDYYLWLNDDTMLRPDALSRLLQCAATVGQSKAAIVVGSTVDAATGALTYGGVVRSSRFRPITFQRAVLADVPQRCDSMTGNIVLIPAAVARTVGNLDPAFEHAMGDTDYALRARQLGFEVWAGPGVFGTCHHNPVEGTYLDSSQPMSFRWRQMMSRKGLP
ncbi:MAG: glycosyltransferase family 2 protein, partial [Glaciimonas sp.]|nr:glycosyltransferase family 2 protein [Glaciimonas sp.]